MLLSTLIGPNTYVIVNNNIFINIGGVVEKLKETSGFNSAL